MENNDIISKYSKVAFEIANEIKRKYNNANIHIMPTSKDKNENLLVVNGDYFITGFSVIKDNDSYCIKIEDFFTFDEHVRKIKYNDLHRDLLRICISCSKKHNVPLGIWVGMNDEIEYEFYKEHGFTYVESIKDRWMKYE